MKKIYISAYLENEDYNVILVDWEPLASSTFYLGPMQNTARVGSETGQFIDYLVKETGLKTEDVHFIGELSDSDYRALIINRVATIQIIT